MATESNDKGYVSLFEHKKRAGDGGSLQIDAPKPLMSLKDTEFLHVKPEKRKPVSARSASMIVGPYTWLLLLADDCASYGCEEGKVSGDRLYFGPFAGKHVFDDLSSIGWDNRIRSLQLPTSRPSALWPGGRFGEPAGCFVDFGTFDVKTGRATGALRFEEAVEIPRITYYRLNLPQPRTARMTLKTGPSTWVQLFVKERFEEDTLIASVCFEPDTVVRDLAPYFAKVKGGELWFQSLRIWDHEPVAADGTSAWPGATSPPGPSSDLDKVLSSALIHAKVRRTTLNVMKVVPKLGGMVSAVTSVLWPNPAKPLSVWNEISGEASELVGKLLNEDTVKPLNVQLKRLGSLARSYQGIPFGNEEKGTRMDNLLGELDAVQDQITDPEKPQLTLSYFVPLANLTLAARREQLLSYDAIYKGQKPPLDPTTKGSLVKELDTLVAQYEQVARDGRKKASAWRLDLIEIKDSKAAKGAKYVVDSFDGWECHWEPDEERAKVPYEARCRRIKNQYEAELDDIVEDAYLWHYLKSNVPVPAPDPKTVTLRSESGPFGRMSLHTNFEEKNPSAARITRVRLWGETRLEGIELFYGGVSPGGVHGRASKLMADVILDEKEFIIGAYGWERQSVYKLGGWVPEAVVQVTFRTNLGRELGAGLEGQPDTRPWMAWGPQQGARMIGVSGRADAEDVEMLIFHWIYESLR